MKNTKTIVSLLLALCMMLSLCACAGGTKTTVRETEKELTPEEQLVGTWDLMFDCTDLIADALEELAEADLSDDLSDIRLEFCMSFDFDDDGDFKFYLDEDKTADGIDDFLSDIAPVIADVTYDMFADEGMSRDEADELFEEQYGMDLVEFIDDALREEIDVNDLLGEVPTMRGTYELDGDELIIEVDDGDKVTFEIELDDDELIMDSDVDNDIEDSLSELGLELPWELEKR